MNYLTRIPVYAWYLFSVAYCYAIWNPYASLWHVMQSDADPALKAVCAIIAIIVGALYLVEGHRSLNIVGSILFFALTGAVLWLAFNNGFRGFAYIHLWGQWVVGLFLTIAVQGGRIYRSLTGRVPIANDVDHHGAHGHH